MPTFDLENIKSFQKASYLTPESNIAGYTYSETLNDNNSGLKCVLYKNDNTGKYVVAFTGFNPVYSINDVENIMAFTNGGNPSQVESALKFFNDKKIKASDIDLITGQSLGGAICQVIGSLEAYKNVQVVTINPIGGGNVVDNISDEFKSNDNSNIKNYICDQDDATKWSSQVRRLGFNPTSKGLKDKTELKTAA